MKDKISEKELKNLDKLIKQEEEDEKGLIPICSKCGSSNLKMTQSPAKVYFRELKSYFCKDCGYEGPAVLKESKQKNE